MNAKVKINGFPVKMIRGVWIVKQGAKWGDHPLCRAECGVVDALIEGRTHCGLCKTPNPNKGQLMNSHLLCTECVDSMDDRPGCYNIDEYGRVVRPKQYERIG